MDFFIVSAESEILRGKKKKEKICLNKVFVFLVD